MTSSGLDGARVFVVGASAGLGRAFAVAAAQRGASVVFAARRADRLADAIAEAGSGHAVALDVTDEATLPGAVDGAAAHLGGFDVVLYAAGVAQLKQLADQDGSDWQHVLGTNLVGAALTTRAVIPHLAPRGIVAYCSSTTDDQPRWGLASYGVTKAALNRLVQAWRAEHPDARFVRVTIGSTFGTEFGDNFDGPTLQEAFAQWVVHAQHTKHMMQPADVANVLADLVTTLRAHPDVDIPVLSLEPPGGPLTLPATQEMVERAFRGP